jgi:GNAT superfamily N-acetyltransferase
MGEVVPLRFEHTLGFDCGDAVINRWFQKHALANEALGFTRTHVYLLDKKVLGFYTLSAGSVDVTPTELNADSAPEPIPAILLGRLAVAKEHQGIGLGKRLLLDAYRRSVRLGAEVAAALVFLHPKPGTDDFYKACGFSPFASTSAMFLRL